jgi:hypothetical protein
MFCSHDDIGFIRVRVSMLQSWIGFIYLFLTFYPLSLCYFVLDLGLHTDIHKLYPKYPIISVVPSDLVELHVM